MVNLYVCCLLFGILHLSFAEVSNINVVATDFRSPLLPCPEACHGIPENWTVFSSIERLNVCTQPVLLDFAISNPLKDPETTVKLRACTSGKADETANALVADAGASNRTAIGREMIKRQKSDVQCASPTRESNVRVALDKAADQGTSVVGDVASVLEEAVKYFSDTAKCEDSFVAGYHKTAAIGIYVGRAIDKTKSLPAAVRTLLTFIGEEKVIKNARFQLCGQGRDADHALGIVVDGSGYLSSIQDAVKAWSNATCMDHYSTNDLTEFTVLEAPQSIANATYSNSTGFNNAQSGANGTLIIPASHNISPRNLALWPRSDCRALEVIPGDDCGTLVSKCGISAQDFTKYNPAQDLCSKLKIGQRVCCSAGTLPDIRPKPNQDGTCASHLVKPDDTCSAIAAANGLNTDDIGNFNDKMTWGWSGCKNIMVGVLICLSKGNPPLPAPQSNAVCGPIKPGTETPTDGTKISDLNPCPLNACCNIWGQCGITPEICTSQTGPTGNPGTAPPGTNGCISNCGVDITNNGANPGHFNHVGYYESWNWDRPCLNLRASSIDDIFYSHIHWAFGLIDQNFDVSVNDTFKQFDKFKQLQAKKILSLGGWGYSTLPATYNVLRDAMTPGNAQKFATNIASFLQNNGLDGIDIDWEYPGAPDIHGIPPGLASDGPNYLSFLEILRGTLPADKSLSIAAPASFWYLKAFPIAKMAQYLDYIVYMTYDLHGQWDFGNAFSQEACPAGSCLRSHVNFTETTYALAMITKAGVPASKLQVGISGYGRSFKMTQSGCTGPMCTYTGPLSGAAAGECTGTPGYISNAEINTIASDDQRKPVTWYDKDSDSDMLVYDDTEWVAFMNESRRQFRTQIYQGLNFGGIIDWAVDLNSGDGDDGDLDDTEDLPPVDFPIPICDKTYPDLDALDADASNIPDLCRPRYTLQALNKLLGDSMTKYNDLVTHGYDNRFKTYSKAVSDSAELTMYDWIYQNGNKYFTCEVTEASICCEVCKNSQKTPTECDYCFPGGKSGCWHPCHVRRDDDALTISDISANSLYPRDHPPPGNQCLTTGKNVNASEPCPPDYSKRGYGGGHEQTVYWTLSSDKHDSFYADLLTNTGIPENKTAPGSHNRGAPCGPGAKWNDPCWGSGMDYNIPLPKGYGAADVANPKSIVQKALQGSQDLTKQLSDTLASILLDDFDNNRQDLVDAISIPVLMVAEAVASMDKVEETADKIDEEKRKALILAFIGAILFIVPFVGEIVGTVTELADIAAIISILGAVGNTAFDIYSVVDDPKNGVLAIFSLILEPLAIADIAKVARAANIRRGMGEEDIAKLGTRVAGRMQSIRKVCRPCGAR